MSLQYVMLLAFGLVCILCQSLITASEASQEVKASQSLESTESDTENSAEKRAGKFYQWAGKRGTSDGEPADGRPPVFYQWAGKRVPLSEEPNEEKRGKFYQWAGKRRDGSFGGGAFKKTGQKFYAWAGKRSGDLSGKQSQALSGKRGKFYQWAGK